MNEFLTWNSCYPFKEPNVFDWIMFGVMILSLLFLFYWFITGLVGWVIERFFTVTWFDYEEWREYDKQRSNRSNKG